MASECIPLRDEDTKEGDIFLQNNNIFTQVPTSEYEPDTQNIVYINLTSFQHPR